MQIIQQENGQSNEQSFPRGVNTYITNEHIKRWPSLLVIRKMQINIQDNIFGKIKNSDSTKF